MKPRYLAVIGMLVVPSADAEIYRWTDESGRVHYGERPPVDDAIRLDLDTGDSPRALSPSDDAERRARQQRMLEAFEYERARKAEQEAEDAQRARAQARQCERLRRYWKMLQYAGPVYIEDEAGERRYLDDADRVSEQARLRPAMLKACGKLTD